MARIVSENHLSRGTITSGISAKKLVEQTIGFVERELPLWRDRPDRRHEISEELLNAQLSKHLDLASRHHFQMVYFQNEERQIGRRKVDIVALPVDGLTIGARVYSSFDPFLVFECKRLPAPSKDREREYVTGGRLCSGGIQRFKLGLYAAQHSIAALIGYIQADLPVEWAARVNEWISDLVDHADIETWTIEEQLRDFSYDSGKRVAVSSSTHPRVVDDVQSEILLRHLWVQL